MRLIGKSARDKRNLCGKDSRVLIMKVKNRVRRLENTNYLRRFFLHEI